MQVLTRRSQESLGEELPKSFYWTVQTYEMQLVDSPVFFFWLRDNKDPETDSQSSAYFNITADISSSSTSPTEVLPSASSDTRASENGALGLSAGAAAGIGVGAGITGTAALIATGILCWQRRKKHWLARQFHHQPREYLSHAQETSKSIPINNQGHTGNGTVRRQADIVGNQQVFSVELDVNSSMPPAELRG